MYVPAHFEETRLEVLHDLVRNHPLATVVTLDREGLNANLIPMELDPEPLPLGTLRGHVSRANPMWRDFSSEVGGPRDLPGSGDLHHAFLVSNQAGIGKGRAHLELCCGPCLRPAAHC